MYCPNLKISTPISVITPHVEITPFPWEDDD